MARSSLTQLPTVLLLTAVIAPRIVAQTPDAGRVLRDQSSPPQLGSPSLPALESQTSAPAAAASTGGVRVLVSGFRFTGYEGLAQESELAAAVAPWVGRTLSLQDLQAVVGSVTDLLRRKGFLLAHAFLPPQEAVAGTIEISVVQAKVDGPVGVRRPAQGRISQSTLQAIAEANIPADRSLQGNELERALLLINDLPGVMGRIVLEQGSVPGSTRVSLDVAEAAPFSGALWVDNFGSRYTGTLRGNALVSFNNPTQSGDQVSAQISAASDMRQARATYAVPFGSSGLRANVSASFLSYGIGKEFDALNMEGTALTLNGWLSYPLVLRQNRGLSVTLGYEFKALKDDMSDIPIRDRRLHSGSFGFNGYFRDRLLGGGYTAWSLSTTCGDVDYDRVLGDRLQDRAGPRAAGSFTRFNPSLSRLQQFPAGFSFAAAYFGQFASGNLSSSEQFSLGGPYGIRAYPLGEASGDEGHQLNLELRRDFVLGAQAGVLQAIGFFDVGTIRLNEDRWFGDVTNATRRNRYSLSGAGPGLNYSWNNRLSFRLSYAWAIGANAGRSLNGNFADGRHDSGHFWATGQVRF